MRNTALTQHRDHAMRVMSDPLDFTADTPVSRAGTEHTGVREYLALARRRWVLILLVTLASAGYTLSSVAKEKPQYRSRATVRLVDASRAIAGDMADARSGREAAFSGSSDPIQSQIQILQSEAVVSAAVDLKGLRVMPAVGQVFPREISDVVVDEKASASTVNLAFGPEAFTATSAGESATAAYGSPAKVGGVSITVAARPPAPAAGLRILSKESAIASILSQFKVLNRPRTDILDLAFTGYEPNITTRVANAMAEAYQLHNTSSSQQLSTRRRSFLETQLRQAESELGRANTALSSFRTGRQSTIAAATAQTNAAIQNQTTRQQLLVEKQALDAVLAQMANPSQNSGTAFRALAASPAVLGNPVISQLFGQLVNFETVRENIVSSGAAPTNPDLITATSRVRAIQARIVDALESQIQNVETRLTSLRGSPVTGAGAGIATADTREAQLAVDVQSAQKLANDLKSELQKAQMSEAIEAGQVEIVQLARNPGSQVPTGRERKLLIGLIVGLMFGFGAAVLMDSFDRRIRKRGDIEPQLGVPGLVVIPRLPAAGAARSRIMRALPGKKEKPPGAVVAELDLVTLTDPRSPSAEAFRTLRTNLMFSQALHEMRMLVVTSASPAEGKTVTASNLAVSFAQQGMRVLLVDCDLRRGRTHRTFNVSREPGLTEFLLGYEEEDRVTHETLVPGLYMVATGKLPPNPSELIGGDASKVKLKRLTEGYDLVVLDSPPLLAASDAAILATLSDGVIMVLRAGQTETNAAQQAMQQLIGVGARIVGAVLNDPESQVAKYGAYYEYKYSESESAV